MPNATVGCAVNNTPVLLHSSWLISNQNFIMLGGACSCHGGILISAFSDDDYLVTALMRESARHTHLMKLSNRIDIALYLFIAHFALITAICDAIARSKEIITHQRNANYHHSASLITIIFSR
jgi:hypothetical protein